MLVIISPTTSTRCDSALLPLLRVPRRLPGRY
nr:MAG TPA: hypothetical protein [Caudoviricetes sp.]